GGTGRRLGGWRAGSLAAGGGAGRGAGRRERCGPVRPGKRSWLLLHSSRVRTFKAIDRPAGGSCMADVTSTRSTVLAFGTIMFTFVLIVCLPNWNWLTGRERFRSRPISSRVV